MKLICFVKQKTAYEMRISDWSSDVCSSDLGWVQNPTKLSVKAVKGSKPAVYKLVKAPTATVQLNKSQMWVASFVFDDWSEAKRDALLGHEQIHYLVGALSARDYAKDFEAIAAKTYDSSSAGIDDLKDALARQNGRAHV